MSRLPIPGSDQGTWGIILNDYLLEAHNSDGTLKANAVTADVIAPNSITATQLASNSVDATSIAAGSITETQLSSDIQASLANANAAVAGTAPDASTTTKGIVQLTGALGGTATAPTIAAGVITDTNISSSAAISQSKVSGLTTSLSSKEPAITAGTTGQYLRGDKTFQTLDQTAVGLANVDNTSDVDKPISTATQTALNLKVATSSLSTVATTGHYTDLSGTPTLSTVATSGSYADLSNKPTIPSVPITSVAGRTGDVVLTSSDVGLGNVNNTSDANKPISTATQTALNLKVASSSLSAVATSGHYTDLTGTPTLSTVATSGSYADLTNKPTIPSVPITTVAGRTGDVVLTSSDVGLGNVNNTSDLNKPISTATQAAINSIAPQITAGTTPPTGSTTSAFYLMGS